jgi:hypothetical protein
MWDHCWQKKNDANGTKRDEQKNIYIILFQKERNEQLCIKYKNNYNIFEVTTQTVD